MKKKFKKGSLAQDLKNKKVRDVRREAEYREKGVNFTIIASMSVPEICWAPTFIVPESKLYLN